METQGGGLLHSVCVSKQTSQTALLFSGLLTEGSPKGDADILLEHKELGLPKVLTD